MREINEVWRPIEGFEGLYEVSNLGRVKSVERIDSNNHPVKERILKPDKHNNGYLYVALWKDGRKKNYAVHRLVSKAFIPNPNNLPEVNHINEIKTDNRVSNLEWMTTKQNTRYSNAVAVNQFTLDGKFIRRWDCIRDIEYSLGFQHGHISKCCKGKLKSAYGFLWKYV